MKFLLYPEFYLLGSAGREAIPRFAGIAKAYVGFDAIAKGCCKQFANVMGQEVTHGNS